MHLILICLLFIYSSLLRCFLLFCAFFFPSLSWLFCLSLASPDNPRAVRMMRIRKGWRWTKWEGHNSPHPWLCWNYGSGSTSNPKGLLWWPQVSTLQVLIYFFYNWGRFGCRLEGISSLHDRISASSRLSLTWRWSLLCQPGLGCALASTTWLKVINGMGLRRVRGWRKQIPILKS